MFVVKPFIYRILIAAILMLSVSNSSYSSLVAEFFAQLESAECKHKILFDGKQINDHVDRAHLGDACAAYTLYMKSKVECGRNIAALPSSKSRFKELCKKGVSYWAELAANNGHLETQYWLYLEYKVGGVGIPKNELRSLKYLKMAARNDHPRALRELALLFLDSDVNASYALITRSALLGDCLALYDLASIHYSGNLQGIKVRKPDIETSYILALTGQARCGDNRLVELFKKNAHSYDDIIKVAESKLSANERIYAQEIASQWSISNPNLPDVFVQNPTIAKQSQQSIIAMPTWIPLPSESCASSNGAILQSEEVYKAIRDSAWKVVAGNYPTLNSNSKYSQGSAVAVGKNTLITNCHILVGKGYITISKGSVSAEARLLAADIDTDRCILTTNHEMEGQHSIKLFEDLNIGQKVYSLGAPSGLDQTFSDGMISGLRLHNGVNIIQTTAPISPGSSGGGLYDERGSLIGITTFQVKGQNLNFAISASEFCRL